MKIKWLERANHFKPWCNKWHFTVCKALYLSYTASDRLISLLAYSEFPSSIKHKTNIHQMMQHVHGLLYWYSIQYRYLLCTRDCMCQITKYHRMNIMTKKHLKFILQVCCKWQFNFRSNTAWLDAVFQDIWTCVVKNQTDAHEIGPLFCISQLNTCMKNSSNLFHQPTWTPYPF